jgi:hypothetical protein
MNLHDLDAQSADGRSRLTGQVRDAAGGASHWLMVEGPDDLVRTVLADADFDIEIQPGGDRDDWERQFAARIRVDRGGSDRAESNDFSFKAPPAAPALDNTVMFILQKARAGGTSYTITVPFVVPTGVNIFLALPFACSAAGITVPTSGDPDLFLELAPFGPVVSASTFGGTATDLVSFSLPLCRARARWHFQWHGSRRANSPPGSARWADNDHRRRHYPFGARHDQLPGTSGALVPVQTARQVQVLPISLLGQGNRLEHR